MLVLALSLAGNATLQFFGDTVVSLVQHEFRHCNELASNDRVLADFYAAYMGPCVLV